LEFLTAEDLAAQSESKLVDRMAALMVALLEQH
jgi:hypothetical protein